MVETPGLKNYILPKLYDRKGDLKKRWYIEFSAINRQTEKLELKRIVCPAKFETKKQRILWGKEHCSNITRLLEKGFCFGNPVPISETPLQVAVNIADALQKSLDNVAKTLRPKSVTTYNSTINKFSVFIGLKYPDVSIQEFTPRQAIEFRDYLLTDLNNTARTANNTMMHLNTIYNHLAERQVIPVNPFKARRLKQPETTKNISFTDEHRKILEKYLIDNDPALYQFTRFVYYAFIRPGELNLLTIADIREDKNYILLRGAISKNGKTETVQIIPPLADEIQKMNLSPFKGSFYIFGKELLIDRVASAKQRAFRRHEKALKACGLAEYKYTLYSWKHTGAVNAYLAGVGLKELQTLLRHSTISMTDIYLKSLGLRTDPNIKNYAW